MLPSLQFSITELFRVELGDSVILIDDTIKRPSVFSILLCGAMKEELKKVEIHDLWLVACFVYPFLRNKYFWEDPTQREESKARAESLTRKMTGISDASHSATVIGGSNH